MISCYKVNVCRHTIPIDRTKISLLQRLFSFIQYVTIDLGFWSVYQFFLDSRMKFPHWTAKNAKKLRKGHATKVPRKPRYLRLKHVSCLYFLWEITTFIFNKSSKLVLRGFNRRWRSKNCDSIVVTRAKAALHVLETSFQAVCSDRVRMMRLDEALQPWDDFVVWDR